MKWISTKERLPEIQKCVLVYLGPFDEISIAWRDNCLSTAYEDRWLTLADIIYNDDCVTHWMELPEKPKE